MVAEYSGGSNPPPTANPANHHQNSEDEEKLEVIHISKAKKTNRSKAKEIAAAAAAVAAEVADASQAAGAYEGMATREETQPLIVPDTEITVYGYTEIPGDSDSESGVPDNGRSFLDSMVCLNRSVNFREVIGILLVVTAGLIFTASNVIQNIYIKELDFFFVLLIRAILQLIVTDVDMKYHQLDVFGGETGRIPRTKIIAQGFLGGLLLLCIFHSVTTIPLGNASAIFFLTPTFTFFFGQFMLGEPCKLLRVFIGILMTTGACLISRPTFMFAPDPPHKGILRK